MQTIQEQLDAILPAALTGSVMRISGTTAAVADFPAPVGAVAEIERTGHEPLPAEVIGFRDRLTLLYPLENLAGVRRGNRVRLRRTARWLRVGDPLLGRVIDAEANTIDGKPYPLLVDRVRRDAPATPPIERPRIDTPLGTGIRAIDGLLMCGKGQRMGIFSGSGVGKSVTLGMIARYTTADVNVIALVGERAREVNEFIDRDLGPEGLAKSVVVVATSDQPAIARVHAAFTATAIAEYFRDAGNDVLLLLDSVTRFAMAQREIGLAAGEPPATRGYPPSVFAMLPKLVERAGRSRHGSITAFYSVLVDGDDPNEPISDAVRGLLDGHTWLSRDLASRGHYPAIDVLGSLSRLMPEVTSPQHQQAAATLRRHLAAYRDHEDLISIGAYRAGSNREVDATIALREAIDAYLCQKIDEQAPLDAARDGLLGLAAKLQAASQIAPQTPQTQTPQTQTAPAP